MYATASAYGSLVTPPGMHGTIQGLIVGLHYGFGECGRVQSLDQIAICKARWLDGFEKPKLL